MVDVQSHDRHHPWDRLQDHPAAYRTSSMPYTGQRPGTAHQGLTSFATRTKSTIDQPHSIVVEPGIGPMCSPAGEAAA